MKKRLKILKCRFCMTNRTFFLSFLRTCQKRVQSTMLKTTTFWQEREKIIFIQRPLTQKLFVTLHPDNKNIIFQRYAYIKTHQ